MLLLLNLGIINSNGVQTLRRLILNKAGVKMIKMKRLKCRIVSELIINSKINQVKDEAVENKTHGKKLLTM